MVVRTLVVALALGALGTSAEAQTRRPAGNPLQFNNPTNQAGMYNANSGPLRFNNPTNQSGTMMTCVSVNSITFPNLERCTPAQESKRERSGNSCYP